MHRDLDLILYGASGFTGRQAAAYLAINAPSDLRWAVAGRDRSRLEALGLGVPVLEADLDAPDALDDMVARARVVLTTAGPFRRLGDPLVAACVRKGTDYCDISGETARIAGLVDRHHVEAETAGVRIVNFCGVSSAPADLAVHLLDRRLDGAMVEAKAAVSIRGGGFNGGTVASIADAIESGDALIEANPFLLGSDHRRPEPTELDSAGLRYDRDLRAWLIRSPMGISDTRAVRRSAALSGRDFAFQEYMAFEGRGAVVKAAGTHLVLAALGAAFRWGPTRRLLRSRIAPGAGPTAEQMDRASFSLRARGRTAGGRTAEVVIADVGDPGNRVTVKCACESVLALALDRDELPARVGVLTPAVAMGDVLVRRLAAAGMRIEAI